MLPAGKIKFHEMPCRTIPKATKILSSKKKQLKKQHIASLDMSSTKHCYSRFRLIGPPVNRASRLIGSNCEEQNPIKDNALR